jgi:hypothetical protein
MSRPVLYLAITSHGFGHAVRTSAVAAVIKQLCPEILLVMVTTTPRWLLESYIRDEFILRPLSFDVGVIQSDSLKMDKAATLEKLQHIRSQQSRIIASEVNFIRTNRVGLILADVPPMAALIAKAAGIPCWMASNFGWDLIYRDWGGEFIEIADWIVECYRMCDRLFRLPMCEPMKAFNNITDVGLIAGSPFYQETELRTIFQLDRPKEKTILLSFGGLGLQAIPYHNLERFPDWQFISFDQQAPDLPNLVKIIDRRYRPIDFMPLCQRVVSKPGYSTFAEAMSLGIPIVSLIREDFAESPILLAGIEDYAHHQIVSAEEFFNGDWNFLLQSPQPPRQASPLPNDGTEIIARAVVEYFQGK